MSMFNNIEFFSKANKERIFDTRWQSRNVKDNILLNVPFSVDQDKNDVGIEAELANPKDLDTLSPQGWFWNL